MSVFMKIDAMPLSFLNRMVKVLLCGIVLGVLFAGLRPYGSYSDEWVSFDDEQNQTNLHHYGLATGHLDEAVSIAIWQQTIDISMRVQLSLPRNRNFRVLAQIDSPGSTDPLIIGQWRSYLIIMSGFDYRSEFNYPRLTADLKAQMGTFADVMISLRPDSTVLQVDQEILARGPAIPFTQPPTRISIGNAPDGTHGWTGKLQDFRLQGTADESIAAIYEFDENKLPDIDNSADTASNLIVPKPGHFPERAWIGTLRFDQLIHANLQDAIINLLGFMPFGFMLYAALSLRSTPWSALQNASLTLLLSFLLSLAIESTQTYIAGRSPHVHDLVLNTLGGGAGAMSLLLLQKLWRQWFKPTVTAPHPHPSTNPEQSGNP